MSKNNHPIEQEELMAYLDGELATNRAIAAAAHLEHCTECQELAADLRKISQELMAWEVEQPGSSSEISDEIVATLEKRKKEPKKKKVSDRPRWSMLFTPRKLVFAGGSTIVIVLILSFFSVSRLRPAHQRLLSGEVKGGKLEGYVGSDSYNPKPPAPPPASANTYTYSYDSSGQLTTDGNSNGYVSGLVGVEKKLSKTDDSAE